MNDEQTKLNTQGKYGQKVPRNVVVALLLAIVMFLLGAQLGIMKVTNSAKSRSEWLMDAEYSALLRERMRRGDKNAIAAAITLLYSKKKYPRVESAIAGHVPEAANAGSHRESTRSWLENNIEKLVFDPRERQFVTPEYLDILRTVSSQPTTTSPTPKR